MELPRGLRVWPTLILVAANAGGVVEKSPGAPWMQHVCQRRREETYRQRCRPGTRLDERASRRLVNFSRRAGIIGKEQALADR